MLRLRHVEFAPAPEPSRGEASPPPRRSARSAARSAPAAPAAPAGYSEARVLIAWVLGRFGLDWRDYRAAALERRVPALLRKLRVKSLGEARVRLEQDPALLTSAIECLLIGVTEFFRDRPVFDHLQLTCLPELLCRRSHLRVLSAGVSDGSELYSVAMLLADAGALPGSYLLGVDCRAEAIAKASAAIYSEAMMQKLWAGMQARYFVLHNGKRNQVFWQLRADIARAVEFRVADLFTLGETKPWDLILFRNVGIYLTEGAVMRAWVRLVSQLAPGGVLVCGKAERPPAGAPVKQIGACAYQKPVLSASSPC